MDYRVTSCTIRAKSEAVSARIRNKRVKMTDDELRHLAELIITANEKSELQL
jgi:hypothetical protein